MRAAGRCLLVRALFLLAGGAIGHEQRDKDHEEADRREECDGFEHGCLVSLTDSFTYKYISRDRWSRAMDEPGDIAK